MCITDEQKLLQLRASDRSQRDQHGVRTTNVSTSDVTAKAVPQASPYCPAPVRETVQAKKCTQFQSL